MTWVRAPVGKEAWGPEAAERIFSPSVFSHAAYNGKYVFSMNPRGGVWDRSSSAAEVWVVKS